ncbi:hypothetical protein JCM31598_14350 [Desulfonatronum parangueonense]
MKSNANVTVQHTLPLHSSVSLSVSVSGSGSDANPCGGSFNVLETDSDSDPDPDCRRSITYSVLSSYKNDTEAIPAVRAVRKRGPRIVP